MKYHGLQLQPMQESGASLLRAIQNESMVRLDLLVRESIQNSVDAAKTGRGEEIRVDFNISDHSTETFASLLSEGIDVEKLHSLYPDGSRMIEIRDTFTEGLTGPTALEEIGAGEPHGNLLKLVYEIGRTRSDEGAGGSWGLGKTCYFRMGIGLVFYYSRIQIDEGYQERLVACLVENETNENRLQAETRTGIAWWGDENMRPIIRASQIQDILGKIGIRRFVDDETGTAIIIPFLRHDLIPLDSSDDNEPVVTYPAWWHQSYEDYLTIAVQRWYCARLDNPSFVTGPRLTVSVNGSLISRQKMLPVFRVVQSLYNRVVTAKILADDYFTENSVDEKSILNTSVSINSVFVNRGPAGKIAGVLLSPEQLKMTVPNNNPDPFLCLFDKAESVAPFRPIITFMRKPGMAVRWEDSTESRSWGGGLTGSVDGRYLIAVFIPEHEQKLTQNLCKTLGSSTATLESYLRSCERADHGQWTDIAGQNIVRRIRSHVGKRIREFGSLPSRNEPVAVAIRMARNLADLLLPQRGAGTDGRSGPSSPIFPDARIKQVRKSRVNQTLDILNVDYQNEGLKIDWIFNSWKIPRNSLGSIVLGVDSENGPISPGEWKENGLGEFPFELMEASVMPDSHTGEIQISLKIVKNESCVILRPLISVAKNIRIKGSLTIAFKTPAARSLRPLLQTSIVEKEGGMA